jgi:putative transposase
MSRAERRALIEREDPTLPVMQQCRLLAVSRSSVYRRPAEVSKEDRAIMALIDRHYLARPYYGSRRMAAWLTTQGHLVNRKRVQRLMRLMGLVAVYQRPNTSKQAPDNKVYPYLLGGLSIARVNQVWCADITYIPMARGFLYLVVIMDWVSRAVLGWRLSNTLGADFCIEALEEALAQYGKPEIFNTDQGCQFTSTEFTGVLEQGGITISMDGKGRCMDNIFVTLNRMSRASSNAPAAANLRTGGSKPSPGRHIGRFGACAFITNIQTLRIDGYNKPSNNDNAARSQKLVYQENIDKPVIERVGAVDEGKIDCGALLD